MAEKLRVESQGIEEAKFGCQSKKLPIKLKCQRSELNCRRLKDRIECQPEKFARGTKWPR
jgi:hypothetical protein